MRLLKYFILILLISIFSACGTTSTINPREEFDLWDYMTSYHNYDVEYQFYHNSHPNKRVVERHIYNNNIYTRFHNDGTTTQLINNSGHILKIEPNGLQTDIIRYVYLGDISIFHSPAIKSCSFDRFYRKYTTHGFSFFNVIEITCRSRSGVYQEFYYGYNEGLVAFYQDDRVDIEESVKVSETSF